jgi:Raf kinase inhibitor-like YbhB/YbcL family protein
VHPLVRALLVPPLAVAFAVALSGALDGCGRDAIDAAHAQAPAEGMKMKLRAATFESGAEIPSKHTCEGEDLAPALSWSDAPEGTKSFALIVDDPDAPDPKAPRPNAWVHWVLSDLPALASSLPEGAKKLPAGTHEGLNDWKQTGYRGPCPPIGRHRYFFKLYALDATLELAKPTKADVELAIKDHVLAKAELMGTYQKQAK